MMTCTELLELKESTSFEAKAAQGRDGNGELPNELWETYVAFANTDGGMILLGAKEHKDGSLQFLGINNVEKVQQQFWTQINNPQKISHNLLSSSDMQVITCDGRNLLLIHVPRADRKKRPVYMGQNPLVGTYLRYHESDIKAKDEIVRHLLADAVNDSNDTKILKNFTLDDLDMDSLHRYRNVFNSFKLDHPFSHQSDKDFLISIGGYGVDRVNQSEGLTIAGLLMFGKMRSILDGIPNYLVDYQEKDENPDRRWIDRITTDGTWSGNLYDFAIKTSRKLLADLKVPFQLKDGLQRVDETHVHEALREALVNSLVHANYNGNIGVLIIKHTNGYSFRNPGIMRVSKSEIFKGGRSDCRNKTLQKMFQFIGWGEQAGSGFPKMLRAWHEQHWQFPSIDEDFEYETTTLYLPTVSLFPPEIQNTLQEKYGELYSLLHKDERIALILAYAEHEVSNQRLSSVAALHSADSTKILRSLVDKGLLTFSGVGRGMVYRLRSSVESLQHLDPSLQHLDPSLQHLIHVVEVQQKKKVPKDTIYKAILELCSKDYMTIQQLASLLRREVATLRNHYIPTMIKEGWLETRHTEPSHPDQAYRAKGTQ
ncbi:MAG: RNA-binding domain-containing protein [Sulfuricurvum sp.]